MQDYSDVEHIVIDGQSTDATLDILLEYDTRIAQLISEPDHGIYDAMNKGIRLATGDVIAILNSDDFYENAAVLSNVVNRFKVDPTIVW